jgi:WD40 repeat protein
VPFILYKHYLLSASSTMLFNPKQILLTGALFLTGFTNAIGDCDNGPWDLSRVLAVGGQKGTPWCSSKQSSGTIINGVEVYYDTKGVNSLQWYYTDGSKGDVVGHAKGDHQRLDWDPSKGELITSLKCWGNGKGEWLGKLLVQVGKNSIEVGKDVGNQDTFDQKTDSGILLGAFGNADKDRIISLGLLFLRSKISKMRVEDVVYVRLTQSFRLDSIADFQRTGRDS